MFFILLFYVYVFLNINIFTVINFQTMENLLFLAEILKLVQSKKVKNDKNELSLGWLLKNLNKLIYIEVSKYPQSYVVVIINFFTKI